MLYTLKSSHLTLDLPLNLLHKVITKKSIKAPLLLGSLLSVSLLPLSASAADESSAKNADSTIDVITIVNNRHQTEKESLSLAQGATSVPDLANWLASVPGANINRNGPITGIAQYRGLYGDRVSTTLDGHPLIGAGPNAMDTPLSYSTPLIVESMTVYRGIAPVSVAVDTLAGAIDVKMRKAQSHSSEKVAITGDLQAGYRSNNNANTLSAVGNASSGDIALLLYGNKQKGDSMESGDGTLIQPTDFDKTQLGTDIRYSTNNHDVGVGYHYTETTDSGTPALPMDIEYIKSHRVSVDGSFELEQWQVEWLVGYLDADHGMTNFLMRENTDMTKYRRNNAVADTTDFTLIVEREFDFGELSFGIDGYFASHDSIITNPNNAMFEVVNFNNVTDNRYGIFAQWQNQFDNTLVQLGGRVKRSDANAGEVSTSMAMMTMDMGSSMDMDNSMNMGTMASDLMDDFNNADRKVSDTAIDIALNTQTQLSESTTLTFGLGMKNRAPSYQERYLWMPMEATGGLADGHTYIGNINLKSETAYQTDVGIIYQTENFMMSPHVFYQNIDDYIQGTPLGMEDMTASMMANMMAGDENPLKFSNVDAKLYGLDINWHYQILSNFTFSGIASYVKGERRDIDDNLYRIAPLNAQFVLTYFIDNFSANLTAIGVDSQKDVSLTNGEKTTAGYGLLNVDLQYYLTDDFTLRGGVDNLFDREYQNHLGGYNRVKGVETPVFNRLPSEGLSAWAEVTYSF